MVKNYICEYHRFLIMSKVDDGGHVAFACLFARGNPKLNLICRKALEGSHLYWICCLRLLGSGERLTMQ